MQPFSLNYENISRRLTEIVIPDYRRRMDCTRLKQRGEEIKRKFSLLGSWPLITLAEAELYRDDLSQQDIRIVRLTMPDFLTLLFDPYSRSEWDDFILNMLTGQGITPVRRMNTGILPVSVPGLSVRDTDNRIYRKRGGTL